MIEAKEQEVYKTPLLLWVCLGLLLLLTVGLYFDGLKIMVMTWENREEYGHGFIIPLISAFLVWQKRNELEALRLEGAWSGLAVLLLGILLYFVGELSSLYIIIQYAFLVSVYGIVISVLGWRGARIIWAALFFLVFMIPLPNFLFQSLSSQLQLVSSEVGVAVIRWFGISVYLEGNVIDLGTYKLQVVEACSGLRYLFPLTSLAFLMAYVFKAALWKRIVVFLSSIPITVLMNSFRIGVIGVLVEYWGPSQAEGFLHDFEGWVVFMACLGLLILEMWLLTSFGKDRRPFREVFAIEWPEAVSTQGARTRKVPNTAYVAVGMLVSSLVLASLLGNREQTAPDRLAFSEFPLQVGEWQGKPSRLESIYVDALKMDDYMIADYSNRAGETINFYTAYYASQSKGESAHSPRSCLPGGGWKISDLSRKTLTGVTVGGRPLSVNRVVIKKGDYTQLVYYWFQERGRIITDEYLVKWYLLWDGLTENRTDGALVRLTILISPGVDLAEADRALTDFSRGVSGVLGDFIPQ